jgi:hypothetical protein
VTGWRARAAWALAAIAGLVLAAGLSTAASTLSRQRIGLSSETLTAGRALAPTPERRIALPHRPRRSPTASAQPTAAPPSATAAPTAPPPPADDSSGGEGDGRPGDD